MTLHTNPRTLRAGQGVAGLIVPISGAEQWCALAQQAQRPVGQRPTVTLEVQGCTWRRNGEVWPDPLALRAGTPIYLAHRQPSHMMAVRCVVPLMSHARGGRFDGKVVLLLDVEPLP